MPSKHLTTRGLMLARARESWALKRESNRLRCPISVKSIYQLKVELSGPARISVCRGEPILADSGLGDRTKFSLGHNLAVRAGATGSPQVGAGLPWHKSGATESRSERCACGDCIVEVVS